MVATPSPAQTGIPWDRILPILPIVFAVPLNVGSWEVHTAILAEQHFDWSVVATALYLGGLNVVAAPTGLLPVSNYLEDRQGCLLFFFSMIAGAVFLFSYKLNVASRAIVYGVGSVAFLIGAQFAKGFGWALVSKQPPPIHRSYVMACNAGAYMLGPVWKSTSELGYRVDGVGRLNFDFHTGSGAAPERRSRAICRRATPSRFGSWPSTRPRSYTSCCSGAASRFPRRTTPRSRRTCPRDVSQVPGSSMFLRYIYRGIHTF